MKRKENLYESESAMRQSTAITPAKVKTKSLNQRKPIFNGVCGPGEGVAGDQGGQRFYAVAGDQI